ncbi:hypothetical protein DFH08DRAFT_826643 [Mycena albidolilacea]|uniref:Uncharacterized protein n=1 Tax=Mycena albidolilacea TaxID=1033008 RepID=A0AAD7E861_9AGAR|nr:hypothetical protein DFH08DRAFT_826643 [Mycena albidolilacea]
MQFFAILSLCFALSLSCTAALPVQDSGVRNVAREPNPNPLPPPHPPSSISYHPTSPIPILYHIPVPLLDIVQTEIEVGLFTAKHGEKGKKLIEFGTAVRKLGIPGSDATLKSQLLEVMNFHEEPMGDYS